MDILWLLICKYAYKDMVYRSSSLFYRLVVVILIPWHYFMRLLNRSLPTRLMGDDYSIIDTCVLKRAVQFGRTLFGRSTFGRDIFVVPSLVDTRVLADTFLVDIVFWSTFW